MLSNVMPERTQTHGNSFNNTLLRIMKQKGAETDREENKESTNIKCKKMSSCKHTKSNYYY